MDYRTKDYITVKQISKKVGVSCTSIRKKIIKGELPGIKSQRRWLVKQEDYEAFYKNNKELKEIKQFLKTNAHRPFFTIPDIMKLFKIAYITAYRWINHYFYLATTKIAHRLYIPIESVREFIHLHPEKVIFHHHYS